MASRDRRFASALSSLVVVQWGRIFVLQITSEKSSWLAQPGTAYSNWFHVLLIVTRLPLLSDIPYRFQRSFLTIAKYRIRALFPSHIRCRIIWAGRVTPGDRSILCSISWVTVSCWIGHFHENHRHRPDLKGEDITGIAGQGDGISDFANCVKFSSDLMQLPLLDFFEQDQRKEAGMAGEPFRSLIPVRYPISFFAISAGQGISFPAAPSCADTPPMPSLIYLRRLISLWVS